MNSCVKMDSLPTKLIYVIIYSLSSCSKPVFSFFCGTPKKIFWRMCVTKQLTVAIDCAIQWLPSIAWLPSFKKNLLLCSTKKKSPYRFGTTCKWWQILILTLSPPAFFLCYQPPPAFFIIFRNVHGPQNILLYYYLNMPYVKRKNRSSALKRKF